MKRYSVRWIFVTVLTGIVLLGAAGYACASLLKDAGEFTYRQRGQAGDAHAADGLKITKQYYVRTSVTSSEYWISEGEFRYQNGELLVSTKRISGLLSEQEEEMKDYLNSGTTGPRFYISVEIYPLLEELLRTYDNERTVAVNLSEYYEYYPLSWSIRIPQDGYYLTKEYDRENRKSDEALQKRFPIPVLENETYLLNRLQGFTEGNGDFYSTTDYNDLQSVGNDSEIFFFVNNRSAFGNPVDMSNLKDGYGIYRIPYRITKKNGEKEIVADADEISLFYPLPEDVNVISLALTADAGTLFLRTEENERVILTVIDVKTAEKLASFDLGDADWCILQSGNLRTDYMVAYGDGFLHVIGRDAKGQWADRLQIPVVGALNTEYKRAMNAWKLLHPDDASVRYAYDGEGKLAIVSCSDNHPEQLSVTILTKDGVQFTDVMGLSVSDSVSLFTEGYYSGNMYTAEWE
jgi:hypothetical protein